MIKYLHYGPEQVKLEVPEANLCFDLCPQDTGVGEGLEVETQIRQALRNPVGTDLLGKIVDPSDRVAILVDDTTRPTPAHLILPLLMDELNSAGIPDSHIQIIIALGSHRTMTLEEKAQKLGQEVLSRVKVIDHDCMNQRRLVDYGLTKRGTRIWVNKEAMEANVRIGVGAVFPHYPSGWAGGAKILLPGIAGAETTAQMHLLGITDSSVKLGKIDTPCRQEMEEFAAKVGLHFLVNVVLDRDDQVAGVVAGDFVKVHRHAVELARLIYEVEFKEEADLVFVSTYPVDWDFFQAMKGLYAAELAVREGGKVVLLSPLYEGVAPTHREVLEVTDLALPEALANLKEERFPDKIAAAIGMYLIKMKEKFSIAVISRGIAEEEAEKLGVELHLDPQSAQAILDECLAREPQLRVGLLHHGTKILPKRIGES